MALRHEKRLLQKSEINLGREGTAKAANFPELRNEIVALKKLEQEQKEVTLRIARLATGKMNAAEAELSAVEKNIARTRSEFEARNRKLNDNIRAQQEAARNARAQHQTVEERKNPAYLNIGRHLAAQGVAPPNAP